MISQSSILTAYSFFHQKLRVYEYSHYDWQRDDIEVAIADYVSQMSSELYDYLSSSRSDFLLSHANFEQDLRCAVASLEKQIN